MTKKKLNPHRGHGLSKTRIYATWCRMKSRCLNKRVHDYHNYGGRGIKVSPEWMKFENFYRDMFPSYYPTATIERINYNGNYEKSNCKWLDAPLQGKNKRSVRKYTFNGETLIGWDWDRKMGLRLGTVRSRIKEFNWSIEKAITTGRKPPAAKAYDAAATQYHKQFAYLNFPTREAAEKRKAQWIALANEEESV